MGVRLRSPSPRRIGYWRVSAQDIAHGLERQTFNRTFEDKASLRVSKRPELEAMLKHVRKGDTVVCPSMDRLGRSLSDLCALVLVLTRRGVKVQFHKEKLTFTGDNNAMSRLLLRTLAAYADFERCLRLERQKEVIAIAKAQGKYKGRKAKLSPELAHYLRTRAEAGDSKTTLARQLGVSRETLYRYLRATAGV